MFGRSNPVVRAIATQLPSRQADASCGKPDRRRRRNEPRLLPKRPLTRRTRLVRHSQQEYSMRSLILSAATVALAGTATTVAAQAADLPKGATHNIVLVHGAFVD